MKINRFKSVTEAFLRRLAGKKTYKITPVPPTPTKPSKSFRDIMGPTPTPMPAPMQRIPRVSRVAMRKVLKRRRYS